MALQNLITALVLDVYDHDTSAMGVKSISCDSGSRFVRAALTYRKVPYAVGTDATVTLTVVRSDQAAVSIPGRTVDEGRIEAELTDVATAVKGTLLGQFKIEDGTQVLRTEVFKINNGVALDIDSDKWADTYQGYDLSDFDARLTELETGGSVTKFEGNTPFTLEEDMDVKLASTEETTYILPGIFLADYDSPTTDDVEVRLNDATVTKEGGKTIFTATGDNPNTCWVDLRLNTLTVGDTYTLTVTRGEYVSGTTGGYFVIYDRDGEELASTGDVAEDVVTVDFVATTPFARVRLFPTTNYALEEYGIKTATIVSAVVTSRRTGTFNGSIRLGVVSAGVTISSTPSCEVYSITQKEEIKVDDALSTSSKNPVQNRRIAAAIGDLSNLQTLVKTNLVGAINEAANSSGSRLAGKSCVFLGDSVAAYRTPPEDIPSIVGQQTGMTAYNCAFGGCRISDYTVPEGEDDPWEAFCMVRLVDAIVSKDWSYQEANIQSLANQDSSGYSPADHFATLKSVNWNNVDFCLIYFAGNDPGNVRFDDPNNSENTFYYLGAFRYSIKKLLTAYPHLKLLVIGTDYHKTGGSDTDNRSYTIDGQTYYYHDWSDKLMEECKSLKIPTLDWYRSNGLNELTIDYYMTSDGKHPNYIGNQFLAGQIAARLLSQY